MRINVGDRARDRITKLEGIVISRTEWLFGCVRLGIQPEGCKDGKPLDAWTFDEAQCELMTAGAVKGYDATIAQIPGMQAVETPGGDRPDPKPRAEAKDSRRS